LEASVRYPKKGDRSKLSSRRSIQQDPSRPPASGRFDLSSFWPNATGIEAISRAIPVIQFFHSLSWLFTKSAQSTGSENTGPERTLLGRVTPRLVNSPCRTTFENMEKIRLNQLPETLFKSLGGGADATGVERSLTCCE